VSIRVEIVSKADDGDLRALREALVAYNRSRAGDQRFQELTIWLRDNQQRIVGGVIGSTYWRWLLVEFLWIDEQIRGRGYGRLLLTTAEREALRRGCRHACLETFSFQAPAFYEKLGYVVFGVLDDFPGRHRRYSFKKDFALP
jgi:GNAT superfamily N-acetyltransferase